MEWYVLNYNFNEKKVEYFNIFRSCRFSDGVEELLENFVSFEDFSEKLNRLLRYCFWCKAEYEIMVGRLCEEDTNKYTKVDIYSQVKPNIRVLAKYILDEYNKQ